jgi:hypothetical protein
MKGPGPGKAVYPVLGTGARRVHGSLHHLEPEVARLVKGFLVLPQVLPAGVVHLAPEPRCLPVFVKADALHGPEVGPQGDDAVEGGVEPPAVYMKDIKRWLAVFPDDVDDREAGHTPDVCDVFFGRNRHPELRVVGHDLDVEVGGVQ